MILSRPAYSSTGLTYPPRCAERAKPGRGKPVLIMHIGFLARFHAISLERTAPHFLALVALKLLVSLISRLVACSARIVADKQTDRQTDRQTHRTTTVTLAAHARRGLIMYMLIMYVIHAKNPIQRWGGDERSGICPVVSGLTVRASQPRKDAHGLQSTNNPSWKPTPPLHAIPIAS